MKTPDVVAVLATFHDKVQIASICTFCACVVVIVAVVALRFWKR